jgi:hypothetical protein
MQEFTIRYTRTLHYEAENEDEAIGMAKKDIEEEAAYCGLDNSHFDVIYKGGQSE